MITIKLQFIIAFLVFLGLVLIVNMIRRKKLELRYTLTWLILGVGIILMAIFPGLMNWLSFALGIAAPVNMLFFLGFCFALTIIFSLTIAASKSSTRTRQLAQELAICKKQQEELKRELEELKRK